MIATRPFLCAFLVVLLSVAIGSPALIATPASSPGGRPLPVPQEDQEEIEQGREADGQIKAHPEISVPPATFAVINHLELDDMLEVDALVNLVTGGLTPDAFDRPMFPEGGKSTASRLSYGESASVSMTSPGVGGEHES